VVQTVVNRWAKLRGLTEREAALEIKFLIDLGTVKRSPIYEGHKQNEPTAIITQHGGKGYGCQDTARLEA